MPTGYTSRVLEGASFEDFALETAGAFSHLAASFSESGKLHDPLPDPAVLGSKYHEKRIAEAKKKLKSTLKMSFARAAKKAQKEFDGEKKDLIEQLDKVSAHAITLSRMVGQVLEYQPPDTEVHRAHKAYMIDQLKKTIEHDADPQYYLDRLGEMKLLTGREWKEKTIKGAKRDIEYNSEHAAKELERAQQSVAFLRDLRAAVKPAPKP
jgi:hypothetical protein